MREADPTARGGPGSGSEGGVSGSGGAGLHEAQPLGPSASARITVKVRPSPANVLRGFIVAR